MKKKGELTENGQIPSKQLNTLEPCCDWGAFKGWPFPDPVRGSIQRSANAGIVWLWSGDSRARCHHDHGGGSSPASKRSEMAVGAHPAMIMPFSNLLLCDVVFSFKSSPMAGLLSCGLLSCAASDVPSSSNDLCRFSKRTAKHKNHIKLEANLQKLLKLCNNF